MASLDSLPADQRAVLQLVLQRGRSYDEIARLLSIDRAAVRQRALTAFDILGPQTGLADQRRALITDYLLGQLPPAVTRQVRDRLAQSPSERAWARVLASEVAPLTENPLPEIPAAGAQADAPEDTALHAPAAEPPAAAVSGRPADTPTEEGHRRGLLRRRRAPEAEPEGVAPPLATAPVADGEGEPRRSSRLGGALLLIAAAVIVVIVIIALASSGGSKKHSTTSAAQPTTTATATTGSTSAKVIAQINLTPPASGSKAAGIAEILREGSTDGIAIVAQNVPPNTTKPADAYAVWLYNSPTDSHILGFVNPGVGSNGRLSTAGGLPANASHYKQLIVTRETTAHPTQPGTIILQGTLTGVS
jgi:hypothetical protein